jgi:hypothetical protein
LCLGYCCKEQHSCDGWDSYIVCVGVIVQGSEQGYEHVRCLHVAYEECVHCIGGMEVNRAEGLGERS